MGTHYQKMVFRMGWRRLAVPFSSAAVNKRGPSRLAQNLQPGFAASEAAVFHQGRPAEAAQQVWRKSAAVSVEEIAALLKELELTASVTAARGNELLDHDPREPQVCVRGWDARSELKSVAPQSAEGEMRGEAAKWGGERKMSITQQKLAQHKR